MPTGGISLNNVSNYLAIPQVVACGGSWIATVDTIDKQDKQTIVNHIQSIHSLLKTHIDFGLEFHPARLHLQRD